MVNGVNAQWSWRSTTPRAIAVGVLVCTTLVGCSGTRQVPTESASVETFDHSRWEQLVSVLNAPHEVNQVAMLEAELVAACMQELGFDHVAHPTSWKYGADDLPPQEGSELEPEELVRRWGLGTFQPNPPFPTRPPDPNGALVAAMSDTERAAYFKAYDGATGDGTGGCSAEATQTVREDTTDRRSAKDDPRYETLEASRPSFETSAKDPRVTAEVEGWRSCLVARGLTFTDEADLWDDANARRQAVLDEHPEFYVEHEDGSGAFDETSPAVQAALARDVEIAVANEECSRTHPWQAVAYDLFLEADNAWYAEHEVEIEAWAADYALDDADAPNP